MTKPEQIPQISHLLDAIRTRCGPHLIGVYLHGSLAMGCFQPARSDIDALVITDAVLTLATKRHLIEDILLISKSPHPIEISFVSQAQLHPWRYPCPYDLHFSEDHRERLTADLANDMWRKWNDNEFTDPDLAVHVAVTRARGICLDGPPATDILPDVPAADYLSALRFDLVDYEHLCATNPVYCILNCCRVLAYQRVGAILSKAEGGAYGLEHLPARYHAIITTALTVYQGEIDDHSLDIRSCQEFLAYTSAELSL